MKRIFTKQTLLIILLTMLFTLAACAGCVVWLCGGVERLEVLSKQNAVLGVIEEHYIGDYDLSELSDASASAMVSALDDSWSYYMTAERYEAYRQTLANTSGGIGVTVAPDEETGGFAVYAVTEDSPAEGAGIAEGDVIVSLNGEDLRGFTTAEFKALLGEQEGEFELGILSGGEEKTVTLALDTIYYSPVAYTMLDDNIGYIDINNFETGAAADAIAAIEDLTGEGAAALIFDVRTNPGGLLTELTELLDYLLPEGDIYVSVDESGEETVYTSEASCVEMPMTVLINAQTYSAAEFFAATLQEYDWAMLVGENTTGKNRSQLTYLLSDGSAVHISTLMALTSNRVDLVVTGGLTPDVAAVQGTDADEQLAAAIEYLLK
ncbi:MAG: S41 family peptidase [Oscillospiraceae bacterium]|nr:S41 family peptidase [Oscillospiraceae bacterium]